MDQGDRRGEKRAANLFVDAAESDGDETGGETGNQTGAQGGAAGARARAARLNAAEADEIVSNRRNLKRERKRARRASRAASAAGPDLAAAGVGAGPEGAAGHAAAQGDAGQGDAGQNGAGQNGAGQDGADQDGASAAGRAALIARRRAAARAAAEDAQIAAEIAEEEASGPGADSPSGRAAAKAERRARRKAERRAGALALAEGRQEADEDPDASSGQVARRRSGSGSGSGARSRSGSGYGGASIVVDVQSDVIARRARRRRFWSRFWLWLSFIVMVLAPSAAVTWYLNVEASDQYASEVSFAVRSLDGRLPAPVSELFGGSADSTVGDSQMLYEYLQSQPLVAAVNQEVDLTEIYNRSSADWLFSMGRDRTIEEMVEYWNRAVTVSYDSSSGIMYVQVKAFRPEDAQEVATAILGQSEALINDLSTGARQDAVRFAEVDLAEAELRLRQARLAVQVFRSALGTADISSDISQQMALIGQLRSQRSDLQADYDSRKDLLGENSPTLAALRRRLESLDTQIAKAEARIASQPGVAAALGEIEGADDGSRPTLAEAAGEQEDLLVELELATNMYTSAQAALEAARAEARRAQRYLATSIEPTLAQEAEYPRRITWSVAAFVLLLLGWSIILLIVSSIRDRS